MKKRLSKSERMIVPTSAGPMCPRCQRGVGVCRAAGESPCRCRDMRLTWRLVAFVGEWFNLPGRRGGGR